MRPIAARYLGILRVSPALVGSVAHTTTGCISAPGVRLGASFPVPLLLRTTTPTALQYVPPCSRTTPPGGRYFRSMDCLGLLISLEQNHKFSW